MIQNFIKYDVSSGRVLSASEMQYNTPVDGSIPDVIQSYEELGVGILTVVNTHLVLKIPDRYKVIAGVLTEKNVVSLVSDKSYIVPNRVDVATVTFTGITPPFSCQINNESVELLDLTLELTSNTPKNFVVKVLDNDNWSNEVNIAASL